MFRYIVIITMVFLTSCMCAKKSEVWVVEGKQNGIVYNIDTNLYDVTVDCNDGYRVVFQTTKSVSDYLVENQEDPLMVNCRWYKCRQWRWIPEVSISSVVATKPKCKPCWWKTTKFGIG